MIENQTQYKVIKIKLIQFKETLIKTCANPQADETKHKLCIESLKSFIAEFEEDIFKYEQRYPGQKI